jgi:hypothetical protein
MEPNLFNTTGQLTSNSIGYISTGNTVPNSLFTSTPNSPSLNLIPIDQIMQNKVAVFKVTRDKDNKITKTEFLKEMWVETKNGQSVDFQVARDKDLADYEISDLLIKTIFSLTF